MTLKSLVVDRRFHGPPNSANGGYVSGLIAAAIDGPAEVTLRRPPPLDKTMILRDANGGVELRDGETLIGSAMATEAPVPRITAPTLLQARAAAARTFPANRHPLPTCFVCGPHRDYGDGLRIHVGPLDAEDIEWQGVLAAPWTPDESLADESGLVRSQFLWAALDCPTGYASSSGQGMRSILLGRQTAHIRRRPKVDDECVVAARQTARDGRKFFAEAELFDASGDCLAVGHAIWIEVTPDVQKGVST